MNLTTEDLMRRRRPMKTAEVAAYLGQSPHNIRLMVRRGQIPARRIGQQYYYAPKKIAALAGMDEE